MIYKVMRITDNFFYFYYLDNYGYSLVIQAESIFKALKIIKENSGL